MVRTVGYGFVVWHWSDDACKDIISWFKRKTTLPDAVETNAGIVHYVLCPVSSFLPMDVDAHWWLSG